MDISPSIPDRVPWLTRFAYSIGNVCETILTRSFELFVLFYYTQVRGLSGTLTGAAILVALIADAVSDPLVGTYSDSLRSRFGRRHTLMFISAIPTGAFFVALFSPPESLQGWLLAGWLVATAVGLRLSLTLFHIPWSTQVAELSPSHTERVTLAVMRNIFGSGAQFAVIAVAFDIFFVPTAEFERGQENPAAYLPFAISMAVILVIAILLSSAGTYRRLMSIERSQELRPARFSIQALWPAWRDMIFRFASLRALILGSLFLLTAFSLFNAFALYLGSYYWGLSGAQIKSWQFAMIIGVLVTFAIGKPIVDRVSSRLLFSAGIGVSVALFALPMILRLIGILPLGSTAALPVLQATNGLAGFFLGIVMIVSAVMASETAEDYESRTGIKATAMLFGFVFLAMKTASGLGKLLAGVIIDIIELPAARDAQLITAAQMDALGAWSVGALLCLGTLGVLAFSKYRSPVRG